MKKSGQCCAVCDHGIVIMSVSTFLGICDSLPLLKSLTEVLCRPVRREEYCSLLVSRRQLERCDDRDSRQRGLFDLKSRELFVISDRELFFN